jgi:SAM-dependent methyltransferase
VGFERRIMIHRPGVSKADVLARYENHSRSPEEYRKAIWTNPTTWENRFSEVARLVEWARVRSWLDVGCGTARLFEKVIAGGAAPVLQRCVGIDAIANNVAEARRKKWPVHPQVAVLQKDIEDLDGLDEGPFDLVTMVGVVYQCGLPPAYAVERCVRQVAADGQLIVTTENVCFKGFVADPHGWYPARAELEAMLTVGERRPVDVTVQYTNPLWSQRIAGIDDTESADYKELFLRASYGAFERP